MATAYPRMRGATALDNDLGKLYVGLSPHAHGNPGPVREGLHKAQSAVLDTV